MTTPRSHTCVPGTTHSLLTYPSAMACWSWSLPAGKPKDGGSCPMMVIDEGSVCTHCYALQGRYATTPVQRAEAARLEWTKRCLARTHGESGFNWHHTMREAILSHVAIGVSYFRIHDSGDFFSMKYIYAWFRLCNHLPDVSFWAPTRAWRFKRWLPALCDLARLKNVSIQPAALRFNEEPPTIPGLRTGNTVHTPSHWDDCSVGRPLACPKSHHHTNCAHENCRMCWDKDGPPIAYLLHGRELTPAGLRRHQKTTPLTTGAT